MTKNIFFGDLVFSLWNFRWNFCALCQNKLSAVVQINSRVSAKIYRKKSVFFSNFSNFFIVLLHWVKFCKPFDGKSKEGLSNQPFTYGEHHSERKKKTPQKSSFRVITAEKNCRIFFGRVAILFLEHRNTLRKTVSVKIYFLSVWDFECNFSVFCKTNSARLPEFLFTCPEKNFPVKKCRKMQKFSIFSFLHRKRVFEKKLADLSKVYSFCPLY